MTDKTGSGVTYQSIVKQLRAKAIKEYEDALAPYVARKLFKKKQVEDMKAGFSDGMNAILIHLGAMGVIVIEDDTQVESTETKP